MEILFHTCVEVRQPMELLFGVVSRVGPVIGVLAGGRSAASGRGSFDIWCPHSSQFFHPDYSALTNRAEANACLKSDKTSFAVDPDYRRIADSDDVCTPMEGVLHL